MLWLCNKGTLSGCLRRGWGAVVGGGCSVGTALSSSSIERVTTHSLSFHFARTVTYASWELAQAACLDWNNPSSSTAEILKSWHPERMLSCCNWSKQMMLLPTSSLLGYWVFLPKHLCSLPWHFPATVICHLGQVPPFLMAASISGAGHHSRIYHFFLQHL